MNIQPGDIVGLMLIGLGMGVIPFLIMSLTSFVKIVVVLTLVRNAMGVQQVPPTMVINGLALVLTVYILQPTFSSVLSQTKFGAGATLTQQAIAVLESAREPFKGFLRKNANERETRYFLQTAKEMWSEDDAKNLRPDDILVLAPAFVVSELTEGFRIGFLLYLAFVVVDLVVANLLVALGLSQASPTNIAIPLKLLLFIALDGWSVILHGLVHTYRQ